MENKEITLALPPTTSRKNYYVCLYNGEATYENRELFFAFYGKDYDKEFEAKKDAIRKFLNSHGESGFYTTVTLTEESGMKISAINKPYCSESAVVKLLAKKNVDA